MPQRPIIEIKTKRGFTLNAFKDDSITNEILKKGEYETNTLNSLDDILKKIKPNVSLDVGANIGNHALVIAKHSKKLIAFEPVKFIFDVLQSNFKVNNLRHAQAFNYGLSDQAAQQNFFIASNGNLGSSSLETSNVQTESILIETVKGDVFIGNEDISGIDFIKMDVEGHEAKALQGLTEVIHKNQPLILLEWNNEKTINAFAELDLINLIFSGYKTYSLSYTYNKKVYPRNLIGFFKRVYSRWFDRTWCLSSFHQNKIYTNIYMVPMRYADYFNSLRYIDAD